MIPASRRSSSTSSASTTPDKAIVLCADEKSAQALDRTQSRYR